MKTFRSSNIGKIKKQFIILLDMKSKIESKIPQSRKVENYDLTTFAGVVAVL